MNTAVENAAKKAKVLVDLTMTQAGTAEEKNKVMDFFTPPMVIPVVKGEGRNLGPLNSLLGILFESSKESFVQAVRGALKDLDADGVVLIASTWLACVAEGETLDCAPSQHPSRESAINILYDDGEGMKGMTARLDGGSLKWADYDDDVKVGGLLAEIMPGRIRLDLDTKVETGPSVKLDEAIFK